MNDIKNFFKRYKIRIIVITLLLFIIPIVAVHLLFKWYWGIEFLVAEWSAGDILNFIGAFLSFVGTVLLGALALWQNQKLSDENAKTQEKFETISNRANELNVISKIIEHQTNQLNNLYALFDEFSNETEIQLISVPLCEADKRNPVDLIVFINEQENKINTIYLRIARILRMDVKEDDDFKKSPIKVSTINLYMSVLKYLEASRNCIVNKVFKEEKFNPLIADIREKQKEFNKHKENYCKKLEMNLHKTMYDDLSLAEIKEMYKGIDKIIQND